MGGMTDKAVGVMLIVCAICWHLYYTVWILVTPWLETSQDLAHWLKYFPDRYYGLALPAVVLVVIVDMVVQVYLLIFHIQHMLVVVVGVAVVPQNNL